MKLQSSHVAKLIHLFALSLQTQHSEHVEAAPSNPSLSAPIQPQTPSPPLIPLSSPSLAHLPPHLLPTPIKTTTAKPATTKIIVTEGVSKPACPEQ